MWMHIPKESYPSTQEEEDSTLDLEWLFPMLEQSVMWREKSRQSQYWSKQSKTNTWMMHLFGQIPQPLTAARGLEKWIGSLEDSHVNLGQSQEKGKEKKMKDGSGMTSANSFAHYDQKESSWKTYQASLLDMELTPYSDRFPKWGMMQNGEVSKLLMSELPTGENVYSYWRTSQASDGEGGTKEMREGVNSRYKLRDHSANVVANWGTPRGRDWKDTVNTVPPSVQKGERGKTVGNTVAQALQNWMTPNTMDSMPPKSKEAMDKQYQGVRKGRTQPSNLREQIIPQLHNRDWKTPTTHDFIEHNQMELNEKGRRKPKKGKTDHSVGLGDQVKITNWMTPMASQEGDKMGSATLSRQVRTDIVWSKRKSQSSLQDPRTQYGQTLSGNTQNSPQPWKNLRLNPMFVEWLMGWPLGYTELTDLEYSEMESYHFKQLTHLEHLLKQ